MNTFSQLPAVKKYSKNGAAVKFFGPSYFDPALASQSIGFLENIQKIFFPKIMDYNKFAPCIPNQLFISSTVPAEEGNPFDNTLRGTIGS